MHDPATTINTPPSPPTAKESLDALNAPARWRQVIRFLVAQQLMLGITASLSADSPAFSSAVFLGVVFAQATLLGVVAGLASLSLQTRWLLWLAGTAQLVLALAWGINEFNWNTILLVAAPSFAVGLTMQMLRWWWAELVVSDEWAPRSEALRFSIRHLMGLTTVVAVVVAVGKALLPLTPIVGDISIVIIFGLGYLAIGLTCCWAMLGTRVLKRRIVAVALVAMGVGVLCPLTVGHESLVFWTGVSFVQAAHLMASLAWIRSWRYRLVAKSGR